MKADVRVVTRTGPPAAGVWLRGIVIMTADEHGHLHIMPSARSRGPGTRLPVAAKADNPDGLRGHIFQSTARTRAFHEHRCTGSGGIFRLPPASLSTAIVH